MTNILKKQWKIASIVIFAAMVVVSIILWTVFKPSIPKTSNNNKKYTEFKYPIDSKGIEFLWQEKISALITEQQKKSEALENALSQFNENKEKQRDIILAQEQQLINLASELHQLEESLKKASSNNEEGEITDSKIDEKNESNSFQIQTIALTLNEQKSNLPKTIHNYVPAGSFVEGILLGGVDAHASVTAQSDPHPVLIRVLNDGIMPNNRNSQLNHCHIVGAAYGDISSERAYIRLERMSCEQNGFFTDYPVFGYVTGADGKDGIRGKVVIRDQAVVTRAFMGGFLSGLSDTVSQGLTTQSISPLGSVETIKNGDALAYGGASGVGNAMELYARYNIKRAEQYQPVIEIPAGTQINVVFNRGFYLDGLTEQDPARLQSSKQHADFLLRQGEDNENNFLSTH